MQIFINGPTVYTQSTLAILASEAIFMEIYFGGPNSFISPNIAILRFDLTYLVFLKLPRLRRDWHYNHHQ